MSSSSNDDEEGSDVRETDGSSVPLALLRAVSSSSWLSLFGAAAGTITALASGTLNKSSAPGIAALSAILLVVLRQSVEHFLLTDRYGPKRDFAKFYLRVSTVLACAVIVIVVFYLDSPRAQAGITLSPLATSTQLGEFIASDPKGIDLITVDYQETSDSVIVSVNATSGRPYNFVRVSRNGTISQFSTASGFPERVYLAVARSQTASPKGLSLGGFTVGDVFAGSGFGTGSGSTIARISADGATIQNPFATLPGETGLLWGGLYFDRTGNFGGDLMVATTTGGIYRVNSSGVATLIARHPLNAPVEGIITIPSDPRFGPLSGKILVGGTAIGTPSTLETVLAVDPIDAMHPMGTFTVFSIPGIFEPRFFQIVPVDGDFFGADFVSQTLFTAPAKQFSDFVGDLVIASIDPSTKTNKLFDVSWDPVNNNLRTREITFRRSVKYRAITFSSRIS